MPDINWKDSRISFNLLRDSISNIVATVLSSAKQSYLSVSRLLSFSNCGAGLIGPGRKARGRIDFICGSSSILNRRICAAKLYRRGEGLSPCACPFPKLNFSEVRFCPSITQADLPVPIDLSQILSFPQNPKNCRLFP